MARLRGEEKRAWERTLRLYDKLSGGGSPNTIDVDDLELGPDEVCYAESGFVVLTPTRIQRTVTYEEGQRPFTLNPFRRARDAMDRAANRAEFERLSREVAESPEFMWMEQGPALVRLTNHRLIIDNYQYLNEYLTGVRYDIDEWAIELRYGDADPVRLMGWGAFAFGMILSWLNDGPESVAALGFDSIR